MENIISPYSGNILPLVFNYFSFLLNYDMVFVKGKRQYSGIIPFLQNPVILDSCIKYPHKWFPHYEGPKQKHEL